MRGKKNLGLKELIAIAGGFNLTPNLPLFFVCYNFDCDYILLYFY